MISTPRLDLLLLTEREAEAIVKADRTGQNWHEEFPVLDDQDAVRGYLQAPDEVFGCFVICEGGTGRRVGTIGFYGPPDEHGALMIGYGLVPSARGQGYATEAVQALITYAFAKPQVLRIVADTLLDNKASCNVLEKSGFTRTHSTGSAHWYLLTK
jgi:RimJ/RimL family protein N-acetyltransferase